MAVVTVMTLMINREEMEEMMMALGALLQQVVIQVMLLQAMVVAVVAGCLQQPAQVVPAVALAGLAAVRAAQQAQVHLAGHQTELLQVLEVEAVTRGAVARGRQGEHLGSAPCSARVDQEVPHHPLTNKIED